MPRGVVDHAGLKSAASEAIRGLEPKPGRPFNLTKIGHVVLMASDVQRSAAFYTGVLGFRVSDVYPETMMKGRMVFMRCAADHHGVALAGAAPAARSRSNSAIPTAIGWRSTGAWTRSAPTAGCGRRRSGANASRSKRRSPTRRLARILHGEFDFFESE